MEPYLDCEDHPSLGEQIVDLWDRGLWLAKRLAIALGLSSALAIAVGLAVTESAFAQIVVTLLAAIAFWIPVLLAIIGIERMIDRRWLGKKAETTLQATAVPDSGSASWKRLAAAAPGERERLLALQRSLDRSRQSFATAALDPEAHDLCVLIDRRLPQLIEHELEELPPDDRGRKRQIGELLTLVEEFARHCSRKRDADGPASRYQAEILRRRFEDRLTGAGPLDQ